MFSFFQNFAASGADSDNAVRSYDSSGSSAFPEPEGSLSPATSTISATDAFEVVQAIYKDLFGDQSASKLNAEYVISGQLLEDIHSAVVDRHCKDDQSGDGSTEIAAATNTEKLGKLMDIIYSAECHDIAMPDTQKKRELWDILLPDYHRTATSSTTATATAPITATATAAAPTTDAATAPTTDAATTPTTDAATAPTTDTPTDTAPATDTVATTVTATAPATTTPLAPPDRTENYSASPTFSLSHPPSDLEWHRLQRVFRILKRYFDLKGGRRTVSSVSTLTPTKNSGSVSPQRLPNLVQTVFGTHGQSGFCMPNSSVFPNQFKSPEQCPNPENLNQHLFVNGLRHPLLQSSPSSCGSSSDCSGFGSHAAWSPQRVTVLKSARTALTEARAKNLTAALQRSERKVVRNVMPTARKYKKCTPGRKTNPRKRARDSAISIFSGTPAKSASHGDPGSLAPFVVREPSHPVVFQRLHFADEGDAVPDTNRTSISSMSSHYGWKSRENSLEDISSAAGEAPFYGLEAMAHELDPDEEAARKSGDDDANSLSMLSDVLVEMAAENKDSEAPDEVPADPKHVEELQSTIDELQSTNDQLQSTNDELNIAINDKDVSIQCYEDRLKEKAQSIQRQQKELQEANDRLKEYDAKCSALDAVTAQKEAMEQRLAALSANNAELEQRSEAMTATIGDQREQFEAKCSEFCTELSKKNEETKELRAECARTVNELKNVRAKLDYFKNRVSKMGKLDLFKSQLMRLSADYVKMQNTVKFQLQRAGQEFSCMADAIKTGLLHGPMAMAAPSDFFGGGDAAESADFVREGDSVRLSLEAAEKERDELRSNLLALNVSYQNEKKLRKKLLEEVIDLKGNIRVFCRVRPKIARKANAEDGGPELMATTCLDDERIGIFCDENASSKKEFSFDQVYHPQSGQDLIFGDVAPLIHSCVNGYNVCIFAYGQTGSGKTYTMEGTASSPGVIYRTFGELFRLKQEAQRESGSDSMSLWLSCLEIYNEKIRDLLPDKKQHDASSVNPSDLKAKLSKCGKKVLVPGLTKVEVVDTANVRDILVNTAYRNRSTGTTNMNEHSSRSHALVFVEVVTAETSSRLVLIDLAGSERVKKTGASGARFDEARNINKSLSALGNVISSLQRKEKHIPYRDSQLTYLLHDCLGGNSKALMFCNISCELFDVRESINTLQFANRVRRVQLGEAQKNQSPGHDAKETNKSGAGGGADSSAALKLKVKRLRKELEDKEKEVNHLRMNNRICKKEITKLTTSIDAVNSKKANHHQTRVDLGNLQKEHSRVLQDVDKMKKQNKKLANEVLEYKHRLKAKGRASHSNPGGNGNGGGNGSGGHSASSSAANANSGQIVRPRTALNALSTRRGNAANPRKRKLPSSDGGGADAATSAMDHQPAQKRRKTNNGSGPGRNGRAATAIKKPTANRVSLKRARSKERRAGAVPSYMAPTRNMGRNGRSKERRRGGGHRNGKRTRSSSVESDADRTKKPTKKGRERNLSLDSVTSILDAKQNDDGSAEDEGDDDDAMEEVSDEQKDDEVASAKPVGPSTKAATTTTTTTTKPMLPSNVQNLMAAPLTPVSAMEALKNKMAGKAAANGKGNDDKTKENAQSRPSKGKGSRSGGCPQKKPFTVSSLAMQSSRK